MGEEKECGGPRIGEGGGLVGEDGSESWLVRGGGGSVSIGIAWIEDVADGFVVVVWDGSAMRGGDGEDGVVFEVGGEGCLRGLLVGGRFLLCVICDGDAPAGRVVGWWVEAEDGTGSAVDERAGDLGFEKYLNGVIDCEALGDPAEIDGEFGSVESDGVIFLIENEVLRTDDAWGIRFFFARGFSKSELAHEWFDGDVEGAL